jgi:sugar lactone lactonase YvrE
MHPTLALALLLGACRSTPDAGVSPQPPTHAVSASTSTPTPAPPAPTPAAVLTVSSYRTGRVHVVDPATGERVGTIEGVSGAQTVVAGPSGEWIVAAELRNMIVRVDPATLTEVGVLVGDDPATSEDETGGLQNPDAAIFGPDGRLYVSSFETDQVLRYEADGTFVDAVVDAGEGGLNGPDIGLAFDEVGALLVPGWYSDRVHRYDPDTREYLGDLLGPDGGLARPRAIVVDGGRTLVAGRDTGAVLAVAADGAVSTLAVQPGAAGLALTEARELLVSNEVDDTVHAFDAATGEDLGVRVDIPAIDGVTSLSLLLR